MGVKRPSLARALSLMLATLLVLQGFSIAKALSHVHNAYRTFTWDKFWNKTSILSSQCHGLSCNLTCDQGPYILSVSNFKHGEGFASALQHRRFGLFLSIMYNIQWIPSFFAETLHNTSNALGTDGVLKLIGFCHMQTRCNICSLKRMWDNDELEAHFLGKFFTKAQQNLAVCERDVGNVTVPVAIVEGENVNQYSTMSRPIPLRTALEPIYQEKKAGFATRNTLFAMEEISIAQNPMCSAPVYTKAYADFYHYRVRRNEAYVPDADKVNVVAYVRLGDVKDDNGRIIPVNTTIGFFHLIKEYFVKDPEGYTLHVVGESTADRAYIKSLTKEVENINFHIDGGAKNLQRDIDILATADILITGMGSFGVFGATVNSKGIIVKPSSTPKFSKWEVWKPQQCLVTYHRTRLDAAELAALSLKRCMDNDSKIQSILGGRDYVSTKPRYNRRVEFPRGQHEGHSNTTHEHHGP